MSWTIPRRSVPTALMMYWLCFVWAIKDDDEYNRRVEAILVLLATNGRTTARAVENIVVEFCVVRFGFKR